MPKKRMPRELWMKKREKVWQRDAGQCVRCQRAVNLLECHIVHIQSGKRAGNDITNLRTLCRRCHVLRADLRHQGMIAQALKDQIIPPNWRELIW